MKSAIWFFGTGAAGLRVTMRIAERLADANGAAATALLVHSESHFLDAARAAGHPIFTVNGPAGHRAKFALLLSAPRRAATMLVALLRHRPKVVIVPMNFALACPLALIVRGLGIRLIYVVHDAESHSGDFAPVWQRKTQKWLIGKAHRVVAMSQYVAQRIQALNPGLSPQNVDVVPLHRLASTPRRGGRADPQGPLRFLFMGRLLHYKGLDILAQALSGLSDRKDWQLTIAGGGPERDKVEQWFGAMPQVDLRLRPFDEHELESLIDDHDVMICPYRDASQSGSVAEALYSGMPSLVTPSGGLAEQIGWGKAGWLAPAATPDAIARTIEACLDERSSYAERSAATAAFIQAELAINAWPDILRKSAA